MKEIILFIVIWNAYSFKLIFTIVYVVKVYFLKLFGLILRIGVIVLFCSSKKIFITNDSFGIESSDYKCWNVDIFKATCVLYLKVIIF